MVHRVNEIIVLIAVKVHPLIAPFSVSCFVAVDPKLLFFFQGTLPMWQRETSFAICDYTPPHHTPPARSHAALSGGGAS